MTRATLAAGLAAIACSLGACSETPVETVDAGEHDAGASDAGMDAGPEPVDSGQEDAGPISEPGFALDFEPIALPGDPVALTEMVFLPGGSQFLVAERTGRLLRYELDSDAASVALVDETTIDVDVDRECGLLSLAVDPDFATNRAIYLGYCTLPSTSVVAHAVLDATEGLASVPGSLSVLVSASGADAGWHNVGALDFGPGRTLHVLFGEKGMADLAQSLDARNGKLLRIVPHADGSGYDPAPGNPYGTDGVAAEVLAMGLRSPWRGFLDSQGRFWIGDVGNHVAEEIDVASASGANFGWPLAEGPCARDGGCEMLVDPIAHYGHRASDPYIAADPMAAASTGRSVWVGLEYRGDVVDRYGGALTGRVLYGEFVIGFVRSIMIDDAMRVIEHGHVGHLEGASAWREGPDGWIYALGYGSAEASPVLPGGLYRVVLAE